MKKNHVNKNWLQDYLDESSFQRVIDLKPQIYGYLDEAAEKYKGRDVTAELSMSPDMKVTVTIYPEPEVE